MITCINTALKSVLIYSNREQQQDKGNVSILNNHCIEQYMST